MNLTEADFLALMEQHHRPRGILFSRAALQCFVASCWPLCLDHPCPEFWADRFLESADGMTPA
jgi:hypothetical protein